MTEQDRSPRTGPPLGRRALHRLQHPPTRAATLVPSLSTAVLVAGLVVQAAVLVHFASQLWFIGDDWDFILRRGTIPEDARSWLEPKNGHWSTLTIVVYRALFAVVGLHSYLPYALVTIVLHLAIAATWYVVLRSVGARKGPALVGSWTILFLGVGGEALVYSAAMNHLWSILLGLFALLLRLRSRPLVASVAVLLASVMFSNTGIPTVFFVVAFTALHEGVRPAARLAALPAAAYTVWYSLFGHAEANTQLPRTGADYLKIPQFVWDGLVTASGNAVGAVEAGPVIFAALVLGTLAVRTRCEPLRHLAWAGLVSAVSVATVLAFSRQLAEQGAGRYSYYIIVFLVPAVALCLEGLVAISPQPRWLVAGVVGALLAGYAVNGISATRSFTQEWLFISRPERDRVLGMVAAADKGEPTLNESSGLDYDPDVNPARLTHPNIRAKLPAGRPTERGILDAESLYMVTVGTRHRVDVAPTTVRELPGSFQGFVELTTGCRTYQAAAASPALVVGTGQGTEFTVRSRSTEVVTQLTRGQGVTSISRTWKVAPGQVHVSVTARDALLFVTFNGAGEYEVCSG